ncbi:MAG: tetratricopeptide repeat protein [Acidobacteriota bacterium]|nr:MAG: tetratricopeptide repeat protein [Acidobacteriota bacterium]
MNLRDGMAGAAIRWMLLAAIVIGAGINGLAQHDHHGGGKPAELIPGAGKLHHPVTTKNAEAQKFFDQGLAFIYGFNHDEARRSFERAAELDPNLAMAWWGIALAVGPNYNEPQVDQARLDAAIKALEKARRLASGATAKERDYIEALWKRFATRDNLKRGAVEYKDAMGEINRRYPEDPDAATLYADSLMNLTPWQLWTKDGKPTEYTELIVRVLEETLKREPQHLGANHLYIHAVEASNNPGRALPSAGRMAGLAPASGHLVHMPSHIYIRTGDYEASAKSNEAAAKVDLDYIRRTGVTGMYPAMYYSHNLHFLVESYNRAGNYEKAAEAAARLADNVRGHIREMPMLEGFLPSLLFVQLRFNKWEEILKLPEPDAEMPVTRAIWRYSRGVALARLGKIRQAEQERDRFHELAKGMPGETPFGLNTANSVLAIAKNILDAQILTAKGERGKAIDSWRQAVADLDALNYDEPPGWYYSVRESLGAALLINGDAAEAEKVFRRDLEMNPGSGRSLFGLAESLKKQGKLDQARAVEVEFNKAWKMADTRLRIEEM